MCVVRVALVVEEGVGEVIFTSADYFLTNLFVIDYPAPVCFWVDWATLHATIPIKVDFSIYARGVYFYRDGFFESYFSQFFERAWQDDFHWSGAVLVRLLDWFARQNKRYCGVRRLRIPTMAEVGHE